MPVLNETNEDYHAKADVVSRSGLWTIHKRTPAHFKYGERAENKAMRDGNLVHLAVLQPDVFERSVRTVDDDLNRNTNVYKELAARAKADGATILKLSECEALKRMADAALSHSVVRELVDGQSFVEQSYYWLDQEFRTGVKCRPDIYSAKLSLIGDLKTAQSAQPADFARSVANFGYHLQEAVYGCGVRENGRKVDGTVFIVVEKEPPYLTAVYELEPEDIQEGWAVYRRALATYADCLKKNRWPGYEDGVQRLSMPRWGFTEITKEQEEI